MTWRLEANVKKKYAAAENLGLTNRLREVGWAGLSAKDTGRIGAQVRRSQPKQE